MESIIELRQQNNNTYVNQNGDYTVTLKDPILMTKNAQLGVKQAFIDTIAKDQGKVIIPDGVDNITFNYALYVQDQDNTRATAANSKVYEGDVANAGDIPSGQSFVLCEAQNGSSGGGVPMCTIEGLKVTDQSDNSRFIRDKYMRARLVYKDSSGTERPFNAEIRAKNYYKFFDQSQNNPDLDGETVTIPLNSSSWHDSPPQNVIMQLNAYGANTPLKVSDSKAWHDGKWSFSGVTGIAPMVTNKNFVPMQFTTTVQVPQNTALSPSDFARLLTRQLTFGTSGINNTVPATSLTANNMLKTVADLKVIGDGTGANKHPYFISIDGKSSFRFQDTAPQGLLVGSSNFDIGFDLEQNVASIDKMHSSIFSGGNTCIVPMLVNGKKFFLNKTGGIILLSCSHPELLTQGLNLPPTIFTKQTGIEKNNHITAFGDSSFPTFFLADGVNVTGGGTALDAFIPKGSDPANNAQTFDIEPNFEPSSTAYATNGGIITDDVTRIVSSVPIGEDNFDNSLNSDIGYYQIEVDCGVSFKKISNDRNNNKIGAIVNKYYSTNNYTIGDSSMSTPYIHNDPEDILITSFTVRILDPAGDPVDPSTLQEDNTVFLSYIKGE